MQYLRSKKAWLKNRIYDDLNLVLLKNIHSLSKQSDLLSFKYFIEINPHYTKYHNYNFLIQDYSDFLQKSFVVLLSDFYKEAYSFKYFKYRLIASKIYFDALHKHASELETYAAISKENYLSLALNTLSNDNLLPETSTH
jgi:hypothetical protein